MPKLKVGKRDLYEAWPLLTPEEKADAFRLLSLAKAEDFYLRLSNSDRASLLLSMKSDDERKLWLRLLAPDDVADIIQKAPSEKQDLLLSLLDERERSDVKALLTYAADDAGGLMNPRYVQLRPEMPVEDGIAYFRRQAKVHSVHFYSAYVVDADRRLLGVVTLRKLFASPPAAVIRDAMKTDIITVDETTDQEKISQMFTKYHLSAIPVVDAEGRMKGIISLDDIVNVVREEATEDMQKIGGMEAITEPYWQIAFSRMIRKRGGWLVVLFLGELLTATAMGYFEKEIARAVILALFIPLIISSGGNSGSQATTLIIRAMALGEIHLKDWWRVFLRESASGVCLGSILGLIGVVRILLWQSFTDIYGPHYLMVAGTVGLSLVGVVLWGTIVGSMLPFVLRKLGFDPASASAPFVATLVDVTGLVIYFGVAGLILRGTLL